MFDPVVLYARKHNRLVVTGIAALSKNSEGAPALDPGVVYAISETLLEKGDVVSKFIAQ